MAKNLNTRIQLKRDSLANWNASEILLKAGEVAIAYVDVATKDAKGNIVHVPTALMKAGSIDGDKKFSELPFVAATAADVYEWAKKESLEISKVGEEEGNVVTDVSWVNGKLQVTLASVVTPDSLTQTLGNYYTKEEADTAFATPTEVIETVNKAINDVADVDSITNITTLVEYANANAGTIGALIEEVYGDAQITDTSRIDTAISDSSTAVETANSALQTAGEAKTLAEGAVTTANEAKSAAETAQNSAAASAADALASKNAAAESAAAALASETAAASSATNAGNAQTAAEAAQGAAETAQAAAEAAQAAAEASNTSATAIANEAKGIAEGAVETANTANAAATKASEDVASLTTKVNELTTDDIEGGAETWIFDCGTSAV